MGMGRQYLVAALALVLLQGCAPERSQPSVSGFDSGHMFYLNQTLVNTETQKELVNSRSALYGDTDQDGLIDAYDSDIDNDGVANLLDESPFDSRNQNTLPHLNLKVGESNYAVVLNGSALTAAQIERLRGTLFFLQKSKTFPSNLKIIALWDWTDEYDSMNGHYDPYWKTIRIRDPKAFRGGNRQFQMILTHELFHAFQVGEPKLYEAFMTKMGWSLQDDASIYHAPGFHWVTGNEEDLLSLKKLPIGVPTRRSLIGPEEHFADALLYAYIQERNPDWITSAYFDNLKAYRESEAQKWTQKAFKKVFAPLAK